MINHTDFPCSICHSHFRKDQRFLEVAEEEGTRSGMVISCIWARCSGALKGEERRESRRRPVESRASLGEGFNLHFVKEDT